MLCNMNQIIPSFNQELQRSICDNWERDSMSDYGVFTLKYKDVARIMAEFHILFEHAGIQKGDRIALCSKNMSHWGVAFYSILTYGAVAVPILHEFHSSQVCDIINHSDSKILFVSDAIWKTLDVTSMSGLEGVISLNNIQMLHSKNEKLSLAMQQLKELFAEKYPQGLQPDVLHYHKDESDEMAILNYTSGTTSNSKGVMIPYRALWSNVDFAHKVLGNNFKAGDSVLSMLPMAHMYGMAFEFLFEFHAGIHINFLTKIASPTVLMRALADVKPVIIIAVPLIIEKVVRKAVLPKMQTPLVKLLLHTPIVKNIVRKKICNALTQAFGGNFYEVIMGGAALNQEIEAVLHEIGFRYCVGYGATECAPIISYVDWKEQIPGSCGKQVVHMELKIDSPDPQNEVGEILTRGLNTMLGYYKNEEATRQTLDEEGWYHTGDLGIMDKDGNLFIKGRSKNMLLGANGQNIYPEEIEDKLSNMPLVAECVVIQKGEKLYGLVYPDMETVQNEGLGEEDIKNVMEQNRKELNPNLPNYARLSGIRVMKEEFEKTPKKSIKRFLYMNVEV